MRGYSYRSGHTELFKHFVDIKVSTAFFVWPQLELTSHLQRAHDPEYASIMDTQLKPKGQGRVLGVVFRI